VFKIHRESNLRFTYQVIKRNWLIYDVDKVYWFPDGQEQSRRGIQGFFSLDTAEACAQGLAEGTWSEEGPIMAEFTPPTPEEIHDDVELPN
jgi:hypothetical protein